MMLLHEKMTVLYHTYLDISDTVSTDTFPTALLMSSKNPTPRYAYMQIVILGFADVLSEEILHHHGALLGVPRLAILIVNIRHAKSCLVAFGPLEVAGDC
jgi:hypothetical protein